MSARIDNQVSQNASAIQTLIDNAQSINEMPVLSPAIDNADLFVLQITSTGQTVSCTAQQVMDLFESTQTGLVVKVGTPVNNQIGIWTGDGTLEGDAKVTFDGTDFLVDGRIITKSYCIFRNGVIDLTLSAVPTSSRAIVIPDEDGELATKEWIKSNPLSPVSSIREVQVVVSPTQLKDLVANPKSIIPAAGSLKVIKIISITGYLDYGTVAFDFVSELKFQYETSGIDINIGTYADWNQSTDYFFNINKMASSGGQLSANEGVVLTVATDATVGDGYITIVVLYAEQDFNISA